MSKVDELRLQFPKIRKSTFDKFVDGDRTNTKKYLKFMLKTWNNPIRSYSIGNSDDLVKLVNMFDDLLPYIKNKDIYSREYEDIGHFTNVIDIAIEEKNEKTFVREEHVNVIYECDNYILLEPKTHRGSLKYGANTKWCTASIKDESTFLRYNQGGFLAYLISKNKDKSGEFEKVAFYSAKNDDPFAHSMDIYNTVDKRITYYALVDAGWNGSEMFQIISMYKAHFINWRVVFSAKENIRKTLLNISNINFDNLKQSLNVIEKSNNNDYIEDIKNRLNNFVKSIPTNI